MLAPGAVAGADGQCWLPGQLPEWTANVGPSAGAIRPRRGHQPTPYIALEYVASIIFVSLPSTFPYIVNV